MYRTTAPEDRPLTACTAAAQECASRNHGLVETRVPLKGPIQPQEVAPVEPEIC